MDFPDLFNFLILFLILFTTSTFVPAEVFPLVMASKTTPSTVSSAAPYIFASDTAVAVFPERGAPCTTNAIPRLLRAALPSAVRSIPRYRAIAADTGVISSSPTPRLLLSATSKGNKTLFRFSPVVWNSILVALTHTDFKKIIYTPGSDYGLDWLRNRDVKRFVLCS